MPTVLIAGECDAKFASIATSMAAAIPNATLAIVPCSGHAAHLQEPQRVAALIAEGDVSARSGLTITQRGVATPAHNRP